jgi:hypothetical protein
MLGKILFTLFVGCVGWWAFQRLGRAGRTDVRGNRATRAARAAEEAVKAAMGGQDTTPPEPKAAELVRCTACGRYYVQGQSCTTCAQQPHGRGESAPAAAQPDDPQSS